MPTGQLTPVLQYIRTFNEAAANADLPDGQLLERFVRRGDETAFELLVRRHGGAVLGVCRRVLRDAHEADDAFQATFLLLVRKAGSLRQPDLLGPWLHGVAHRIAVKAKALVARRQARERPFEDVPAADTLDDLIWRDLRPVLDGAIQRLPPKYRVPFVLCYLEGMTNAQAAQHLGCPAGTIATRLSRARAWLRSRLVKQGLTLSAAALATILARDTASAKVPPVLLASTVRSAVSLVLGSAAASVLPGPIASLMEGVWRSMILDKWRIVLAAVLTVVVSGSGAGVLTYRALADSEPPVQLAVPAPPVASATALSESVAVRSTNFVVEASSRRIAQLVSEMAERQRKEIALQWLGQELPPWYEPCRIQVRLTMQAARGYTVFNFEDGKVKVLRMELGGPLDRVLASCLPHEMTHAVLADHFRQPLHRWADEGAAILSEDEEELKRHEKFAQRFVTQEGPMSTRRLLYLKEYPNDPKDVVTMMVQSYSLTRFLVERKDRPTFLKFLKQGMELQRQQRGHENLRDDWDPAIEAHYGYRNVVELEDAWLADLRQRHAASSKTPPPVVEEQTVKEEIGGQPAAPSPFVVVAVLRDRDQLVLKRPLGEVHEKVTSYIRVPGEDKPRVEVRYVDSPRVQVQNLTLSDVSVSRVTATGTEALEPKEARRLLRTETPVLMFETTLPVDPLFLQVVKEGTILLTRPARPPARSLPPDLNVPVQPPPFGFISGLEYQVPISGPMPISLDFGFPVQKENRDKNRTLNFWLGFFH